MRYGTIPTNIFERLALASGKVPVPVIDALFGPLKTRAIMAGVKLGLFEAMREGDHAAGDLASRLRLDPGALELLLRTLVACDYLVFRRGRFALSRLARRTMVTGAPMQLTGYLRFNYQQWEFIERIEDLVRTGRGLDFHESMRDPDAWRDYQEGMLEVARLDAPVVAARVPVRRGARTLLDLAGSHGLFGAAICRRHPPMTSTVLDLPQAIPHARDLGRREGLDGLVTYREGNLLGDDYGRDIDVILLSNILHHFDDARILDILARAHTAARAGGTIAIWEIEAPEPGSPVTAGDAIALYFRLTSTAGAYHGRQYADWLRRAGFERIKIVRPALSPGSVLVTARR